MAVFIIQGLIVVALAAWASDTTWGDFDSGTVWPSTWPTPARRGAAITTLIARRDEREEIRMPTAK